MKKDSARTLYNRIGDKYAENKSLGVSDLTELPSVMRLAGDVRGLRALDAGCGPGRHSEQLIRRGARVTGIDVSDEMVALARRRCGGRGEFRRADFTRARFAAESFDLIVASLCLMYARDPRPAFRNFARWLAPEGRLIFSLYHPVRFFLKTPGFDFSKSRKVWIHLAGCDVTVWNYYHPLEKYFEAMRAAGLAPARVVEPVLSRRHKGWSEDNYLVPRSLVVEARKLR